MALLEHHGDTQPGDPDFQGAGSNPPSYIGIRIQAQKLPGFNGPVNATWVEYQDKTHDLEYYNDATDPYQVDNVAQSLTKAQKATLHKILEGLHKCHTGRRCWKAGLPQEATTCSPLFRTRLIKFLCRFHTSLIPRGFTRCAMELTTGTETPDRSSSRDRSAGVGWDGSCSNSMSDAMVDLYWEVRIEHWVPDDRCRFSRIRWLMSDWLGIGHPPLRTEVICADEVTTVPADSVSFHHYLPYRRLVRIEPHIRPSAEMSDEIVRFAS